MDDTKPPGPLAPQPGPHGAAERPTSYPAVAGGGRGASPAYPQATAPLPPYQSSWEPTTEGRAIWALVCAFLAFVFSLLPAVIAFVLAAQASRRIRQARGARTGRGLVIAARITAVVGVVTNAVVAALLVASGVLSAQLWLGEQTTVKAMPLSLEPGDCLQELPDGQLSAVTVVECAQPHAGEVFASLTSDADGPWPGEGALRAVAEDNCRGPFREYVGIGYDDSGLWMRFLIPSEDAWVQGDHRIDCVLEDFAGAPMVGSRAGRGG